MATSIRTTDHDEAVPGRGDRLARHLSGPGIAVILSLAARLRRGRLTIVLPDSRVRVFQGQEPGPEATLEIRRGRLARRYLTAGGLGFAESFVDGDWDTPDLVRLLLLLDLNADAWSGYYGSFACRLAGRLGHALRANHRRGSRRNIRAHYDLGNAFFAAWLDPTMLYSSAYFAAGEEDLGRAQIEKCRRLARRIELGADQTLLEIGSGWGAFAILAAREFGARVTSITISREQHELARRRVFEEGLGERVEIRFEDYRDVAGRFDRIASIEMMEAVGEAYWPTFFGKLRERLAPGGIAGLQVITVADRHFEAYRQSPDFIQRYIFPGGMLPSPRALARAYGAAGLQEVEREAFGRHYARTLGHWHARFQAAWQDIARQGFDERFKRIWTYYLAYCEAGFRSGSIDVVQTALRPS